MADITLARAAAVHGLDPSPEPGIGYVVGEARTVQAAAAQLVRGYGPPRRSVLVRMV